MRSSHSPVLEISNTFDESKIVYIKELRVYAYLKGDQINTDDKQRILLFDNTGKKVRSREEAIELVNIQYHIKNDSGFEKAAKYATYAWVAPLEFSFNTLKGFALLPVLPYLYYSMKKDEKHMSEYFQVGVALFEKGNYVEAREKFFLALSTGNGLIYSSHIYFKIAETYHREGDFILAEKYYKAFLDYSIALYPDFYKDFSPALKNDFDQLDREFTIAEEKLKEIEMISNPSIVFQKAVSANEKISKAK